MCEKISSSMDVIGTTEFVDVAGIKKVPAKIDTGADSSAIWASQISVSDDKCLNFCLFDKGSDFYTGEILKCEDFRISIVRNSFGHAKVRYAVELDLGVSGHSVKTWFTLADRSHNSFPILIGCRAIAGKFYVDVSKDCVGKSPVKNPLSDTLHTHFQSDPVAFHRRYIEQFGGDIDKVNLGKA